MFGAGAPGDQALLQRDRGEEKNDRGEDDLCKSQKTFVNP